ncbi:hypothetical protein ATL31_2783 [Phycicoccus duodecadis]|uniref:Uncharacterized protein n=1 Tax=Phycicoccus duodecadis TaxID=173053 RepID=A0A2N3YM67_9MICO|nr:hypothetical protein ATL31_2783 [Phycicoccus duodecadis]
MRRFLSVLGLLTVLVATPAAVASAAPASAIQYGHCAVC